MDDYFEPAPFMWVGEDKGQASTPRTRKKVKRRIEYVSWGSRELIDFLKFLGKDTDKALSQYDVTGVINQYVNGNKLVHPHNKRRVLCDERLYSLFGKKTIFRNKIHDLLESHFAENKEDSEDDIFGSSDDNDENGFSVPKKQRILSLHKITLPKKKAPEVSKSCLAAINSDNIKLLYLGKSLVEELLNNPETFESKVVGSIVRVKADPHDIFQKNSHQLQLVTGVMKVAPAGDTRPSTLLQISGVTDNISISELSEEKFSEEEIEDLRRRVKDGLLKHPTVGELEQKAVVLHEDITKNWLARELILIRNLIDRANEKGWRHKVREHLDRQKLLQSPDEQLRLLSEIPKVMAEEVKPELISDSSPDDSPKAADWDWEPFNVSPTKGDMTTDALSKQNGKAAAAAISSRSNGDVHSFNPEEINKPGIDPLAAVNTGHGQYLEPEEREAPKAEPVKVESNGHTDSINLNHVHIPRKESNCCLQLPSLNESKTTHLQLPSLNGSKTSQLVVIDLSDDDEEQDIPNGRTQILRCRTPNPRPHPELMVWHYFDPLGNIQGPFSLISLKRWSDANYFGPDFRVWSMGQSPEQAVLLNLILQHVFPN